MDVYPHHLKNRLVTPFPKFFRVQKENIVHLKQTDKSAVITKPQNETK